MKRAAAGCLQMMSMMSSPLKRPVSPRKVFSPLSWSSGTIDELGGVATVGLTRDGVGDGPAGEGTGAFLNVVLGVVVFAVLADAEGEQLEKLTAVVLVDGLLVAEAVIEEEDHRGVFGNLDQEFAEATHPMLAEHFELVVVGGVALHLAVGGAEDAVPEEDHLFLELGPGVDEPPSEILGDATGEVAPLYETAFSEVEVEAVGVGFGIEQLLHCCFISLLRPFNQVVITGTETGPTHKVGHEGNILVSYLVSHRNIHLQTWPAIIRVNLPFRAGNFKFEAGFGRAIAFHWDRTFIR